MPALDLHALNLHDEAATVRLGRALAAALHPGDAILLDGPLGAGKTTLARALIRAACHQPTLEVPSPTYTLCQDYESPHGLLTHYDLWRLDRPTPDALEELGWRDSRTGIVLVEWPDRLGDLRPPDALTVSLAPTPSGARTAHLHGWPADRLLDLLTRAGAAP